MFSDFFPPLISFFKVELCSLPSTKHCIYSHISPWICRFLIAFTILIPAPITSLSKLALEKKEGGKRTPPLLFPLNFCTLFSLKVEWLLLFLLLSPLVHIPPMKGKKVLRIRSECVLMWKSFCSNCASLKWLSVFILLEHLLGIMSGSSFCS